MKQKLYYLACARLPTKKAHGLQITKMCEAFYRNGLDVKLWVTKRKNPNINKGLFDYYNVNPNCFLFKEVNTGLPDYSDLFPTKLIFWLRKIIFVLVSVLNRPVKENAIIYTREIEIAFVFSLLGYRTAYEDHGWPESKIWLYKFMLNYVEKAVVLTEKIKCRYERENLDCDVRVSADGVDIKNFNIDLDRKKARKKLNLDKYLDSNIITYVGKFTTKDMDKGLDMVVESLARLRNTYCLLVGGNEEEVKYFKNKAKALSTRSQLMLFPHQCREEVPLFLKASDILLLPYPWTDHYAYNMSPLKLFEYMASKRSILTSDLPAIKEVLSEDNAFFFEPGDKDSFSQKVKYILDNQEEAKEKVDKAFNKVQEYSWKSRAKRILSFIEK